MNQCKVCRSYAVDIDPKMVVCDVCYYREAVVRIEKSKSEGAKRRLCREVLGNEKDARNRQGGR